ncbi:MAG: hypothetical protein G01um101438_333 [Parcubacteria group bacterium Gr01-1014_38]|nr:MAG: hypothetical protein G01um101438_333 [Parcubacteria group bacterium Gr01-1014_38]
MAKRLTIILGAGASYSVNPDGKALDTPGYRPPLAHEIFRGSREFRVILNKYPLAELLASDIDRRIKQNRQGVGLEQILRSYEQEVTAGRDSHIARQFLQIPLYLNELFGEITTHFTKQPDEYNNLVNIALGHLDEVLFLTLNYDNLFEIALSRISSVDFSAEHHYTHDDKWKLVKLHGSVNWYRQFSGYQITEASDKEYFAQLQRTPLPLQLDDRFILTSLHEHARKYIGNAPVYPALTVPVDGKYQLNSPPEHIQSATDFLSGCENYLIIGTSGRDRDLLDLLQQHARQGKVLVVGREQENAERTKRNFQEVVPQFRSDMSVYSHPRGFSEFVDSGALDEFLHKIA